MNDRQKIKAEIEKRMKNCEKGFQICPSTAFGSRIDSYKELLSFIDSLPENAGSDDLDDEIVNWCNNGDLGFDYDYEAIRDTAHHFANWQKQQLMKDAIEGEIGDNMPLVEVGEMNNYLKYIKAHRLKTGDKVKVILIKGDEK